MRALGKTLLLSWLVVGVAFAQAGDLRQAAKSGPVVQQVLTAGVEFQDRIALVGPAALVVVGQVVDERPRLAADGSVVLTDYTIEVSEVWVDPQGRAAPGERLVVSNPGGQMRLEGVPVRIETPDFEPLPWLLPYVFFLDAAEGGYRFRGGAQGVWAVREGRVHSHLTRKYDYVVRRLANGEELAVFRQKGLNASPSQPPAAGGRATKPAGERRREVIRPDYAHVPGLGERLIAADAVVRARVTDQAVQLAADGKTVSTDYTVEVLEVYKQPNPPLAAGASLTVRAEGGNLVRGENVVSVVNELFPPLPWAREHIFFLRRAEDGSWRFLDGAMSVFRLGDEGKMRCHAPRAEWDFFCTSRDGRKWEELLRDLKKR